MKKQLTFAILSIAVMSTVALVLSSVTSGQNPSSDAQSKRTSDSAHLAHAAILFDDAHIGNLHNIELAWAIKPGASPDSLHLTPRERDSVDIQLSYWEMYHVEKADRIAWAFRDTASFIAVNKVKPLIYKTIDVQEAHFLAAYGCKWKANPLPLPHSTP
jgi:hypothetical protein